MSITSVSTVSPLMQAVEYQGQTYFTSRYFHQRYITNSAIAGKYRQHHNFLRVLRAVEAYQAYTAWLFAINGQVDF